MVLMKSYIESNLDQYKMVKKNNEDEMRKQLIGIALLITSSLFAGQNGPYIGIDAGKVKGKYNVTATGYNEKTEISDTAYTFKIGTYLNDNNRAYGFYQHVDPNADNASFKQYGIGYDYLIGNSAVKPFIGVLVGRMETKIDNSLDKLDISGNFVGGHVGINYAVNPQFGVEVGYRYFNYSSADGRESVDAVNVEVDHGQNWFAGITYKF